MKKIIGRLSAAVLAAFAILSLCILLPLPAGAASDKYAVDGLGLFSDTEKAGICSVLESRSAEAGADFVVMTTRATAENASPQYALDDAFENGTYLPDGLVFVICEDNGDYKYYMIAYGKMQGYMQSEDRQALYDSFDSDLDNDDYITAFTKYADGCLKYWRLAGQEMKGEPGDLVVDLADILTDAEERELRAYLKTKSAEAGADIVVVSINNLRGKSMMDYADDYYDKNGYSKDGVLFLRYINGTKKETWISTAGSAEYRIDADDIFDAIESDFRQDKYLGCFKTYADMSAHLISTPAAELRMEGLPVFRYAIISLIVGLIVAFIHVGKLKRQLVSVERQQEAGNYVKNGSMAVTNAQEVFLYATVSRVRRDTDSSSRGGGGGGHHTSSSGVSHGGGGRSM